MAKPIEVQHLARTCNEALILGILQDGPKHGYQIALEIDARSDGMFRFNHGTLYPILHRLEKDYLIRGSWDEKSPKRKRKCYTLTDKGRKYLLSQREAWQTFFHSFFTITGGESS